MDEKIKNAPIGVEKIQELNGILQTYRAGKSRLDRRIIDAERWWKLRNEFEMRRATDIKGGGFRAETSWLHNVITAKHADAIAAYPEPNILAREEGDRLEAWALSKIIPVVLKYNDFEKTYDAVMWQKLKTGTGVYKIIWDPKKLNGLGDISIKKRDLLCLFWEPGIADIQDSKYLFDVEMVDIDLLRSRYPFIKDGDFDCWLKPEQQPADDTVSLEGKAAVIDVYYKKGGKLHFMKYTGETVLFATENEPEYSDGLYAHGLYPYVFDTLFPVESSPAGYGYVDICANAQIRIDLLNTALLKNSVAGATPRFFLRSDGGVNEEELLNVDNTIVHVTGNLGEDSLRTMDNNPLNANHLAVLNATVEELRSTSGNTDAATGSYGGGVTAATAISALQEAAGKTSKAATQASYNAYAGLIYIVIELIRQYYKLPRQFRILGSMGKQEYITFDNSRMQPQLQPPVAGLDMGYRLPVYDIDVVPQAQTVYTKLSQNELALQLYSAGFFDPALADRALVCLGMMDFEGKDGVMQQIASAGGMNSQLEQWQSVAVNLAAKYEPELLASLGGFGGDPAAKPAGSSLDSAQRNIINSLEKTDGAVTGV